MLNYFELAEEFYVTERDKNRLTAICKAKDHLNELEKSRVDIVYMLEDAKRGNFAALVETYVSVEIAKKYE